MLAEAVRKAERKAEPVVSGELVVCRMTVEMAEADSVPGCMALRPVAADSEGAGSVEPAVASRVDKPHVDTGLHGEPAVTHETGVRQGKVTD